MKVSNTFYLSLFFFNKVKVILLVLFIAIINKNCLLLNYHVEINV